MHSLTERFDGVAGQDLDRLLGHDRPGVKRICDYVHSRAGRGHACCQRLLDGVHAAAERGQK